MPKPRPPHLRHEKNRHGTLCWYVRIGDGPRIRLRSPYGTDEFWTQYHAAVAGQLPIRRKVSTGTLEWLITRYREVNAWTSLSPATRKKREAIFRHVIKRAGNQKCDAIRERHIANGRDEIAKTAPSQARHFLDAMRGLFKWSQEAGHVPNDPAANVAYPLLKSGDGFPAWTDDDVAAYVKHWPIGTRQYVWFAVLRWTGVRRGDAVRLGPQHERDGELTFRTEKTNAEVTLEILPELREAIDAGPTADLAFICGANGERMVKESFGNAFSEACRAAGVKKSAHGLRKLAATTVAQNGANESAMNALFGWTGSKMAAHYTSSADRQRLGRENSGKLRATETEQKSAAPMGKVRRVSLKRK